MVAIAALGGSRGHQAAIGGVLTIGVPSASVNLSLKPLARQPRPDPAGPALTGARQVPIPGSDVFPSGHAGAATRQLTPAPAQPGHIPGRSADASRPQR